ncbi:MAG TPA: low molecular weight protein-tyrosine-phosphatase [Streptosporangiaceae bacterium]|jgi:protein-tyrosine phosphatase|nr:low molecular weight protein-tyrosine-phosphatase [Streptosporangiaceae bacterium]
MAADSDAATSGVPAPRDPDGDYRILLVCLGNICRSPMAEVILRDEIDQAGLGGKVTVESAGTGDWHVGGPMDERARTELRRRGYDGSQHIARQIAPSWLPGYDLFVVMDQRNLANLRQMATSQPDPGGPGRAAGPDLADGRIRLMRSFDPAAEPGAEVPDPYHGGPAEYEETFELVQAAARGLTARLAERLGPRPSA